MPCKHFLWPFSPWTVYCSLVGLSCARLTGQSIFHRSPPRDTSRLRSDLLCVSVRDSFLPNCLPSLSIYPCVLIVLCETLQDYLGWLCQRSLLLLTHQFIMSCFLCSTSGEVNNDIVVEMKTDKANEEAGLLNKRPPAGQVRLFPRAFQNCVKTF